MVKFFNAVGVFQFAQASFHRFNESVHQAFAELVLKRRKRLSIHEQTPNIIIHGSNLWRNCSVGIVTGRDIWLLTNYEMNTRKIASMGTTVQSHPVTTEPRREENMGSRNNAKRRCTLVFKYRTRIAILINDTCILNISMQSNEWHRLTLCWMWRAFDIRQILGGKETLIYKAFTHLYFSMRGEIISFLCW